MLTRRLPLANTSLLKMFSLRSKVCFGGFIVQIKQMFSCCFYLLGGHVVYCCSVAAVICYLCYIVHQAS